MTKWPYMKRIYWNIELFEQCMQYLLFQASHWSRSNGWDQFTKTKVSYKLLAKLFLCDHDVLFHFNPNWNWGSLIERIEWDLIFVGGCYCWSQIDIGGVRQYWTSICQVRSTTLQLWNNFFSLATFKCKSSLKRKSRGQVSQIGQHPPSLRFSGVNG